MAKKPVKTLAIWVCRNCGQPYAKWTSCWCCVDMDGHYQGKTGLDSPEYLGEFTVNQLKKLRPYRRKKKGPAVRP